MKSLITTVIATLLVSMAAVYGVAHRDELRQAAAGVPQLKALLGLETKSTGDEASATADAGEERQSSPYDVTLAANDQGHFETEAEVNGRGVDVMVDTGATIVALTYEDAERAGIYLNAADFTHTVSTANGSAKVAPVTISTVSIGNITVRNVEAAVAESGKLHKTLLGMSFLGRLSRVEMRSKNLVLQE